MKRLRRERTVFVINIYQALTSRAARARRERHDYTGKEKRSPRRNPALPLERLRGRHAAKIAPGSDFVMAGD
jgi:hypothetical protein